MNGIVDVITLLLGLSGFGLQPNPRPPTPDASLQYAIADADVVVHLDTASIIPGNYRRMTQLADQPELKSSPQLAKAVRQAVTEADSARGLVKSMTGVDLATDVADMTVFVQLKAGGADPSALLAVHGKFAAANIEAIATVLKKSAVKKAGATSVDVDGKNSVAVTADGVLLFGTRDLVTARTQGGWKAPGHAAGTALGYAADMLGGKPVFGVSVSLSPTGREAAVSAIGGQNFATDVLKRGKAMSFAVYHDGIGWTWFDSTKPGLDAMTDVSNGFVDLLRAAQIAPRGFAKIVLGGLESYRGDPQVDELLRHKADLVKVMDAYIGDGTFKAKVDPDAKNLKLTVRLTGKSVSDVIPLGAMIPAGAIAFLSMRGESTATKMPPPSVKAPPLAPSQHK